MLNRTSTKPRAARASSGAALQDVLVLAEDRPSGENALAYAEALTPDGNVAALILGVIPNYPTTEFSGEAWLVAQREAQREAEQAELVLREKLESKGSRAELRRAEVMSGDEGRALSIQGQYADATVIGWPTGDASRPVHEFEGALFESGRPVILVPEAFSRHGRPKTIMIAWTATREATRAIHDAMPLLREADLVQIVIADDRALREQENPGDDIARHLARHDITVEVKHVPTGGVPICKVLLDEARYLGADMLIMGGYGHSRTGEWLFGGVTQDMLAKMTVPVLMSH